MKTLIIYAHPETEGHNTYILERVKENLEERKENFEVVDLYKINYDPILKENEHYTAGEEHKKISEQNKKFQEKIKNTDKIITIFPVWWGSYPAILRGFFDRVLTPGFAFRYSRKKLIKSVPYKLLKGKKAVVFMTSGGPKIGYLMLGNSPKISIKYFTLWFSGITSKIVHFYNCINLQGEEGNKKKKKIDKKVRKKIKWLYK